MRRPRLLIAACCLCFCLVALAVPALALAGGSAGDQQYTDPFGGSHSGGSTATQTQSATNTPPAGTEAAPPATTPPPAATTPVTPAEPTATIADPTPQTLPYTGYAAWMAAGFGVVLLGSGLTLRLRTRSAR